jgi:hypothetical protein
MVRATAWLRGRNADPNECDANSSELSPFNRRGRSARGSSNQRKRQK